MLAQDRQARLMLAQGELHGTATVWRVPEDLEAARDWRDRQFPPLSGSDFALAGAETAAATDWAGIVDLAVSDVPGYAGMSEELRANEAARLMFAGSEHPVTFVGRQFHYDVDHPWNNVVAFHASGRRPEALGDA